MRFSYLFKFYLLTYWFKLCTRPHIPWVRMYVCASTHICMCTHVQISIWHLLSRDFPHSYHVTYFSSLLSGGQSQAALWKCPLFLHEEVWTPWYVPREGCWSDFMHHFGPEKDRLCPFVKLEIPWLVTFTVFSDSKPYLSNARADKC